MTPGIHKDIPAEQYHSLPGASASRLKTLARSPAHCRHEMDHPGEPTDAMRLGTLVHTAVLEPAALVREWTVAGPCSAVTGKGEPCRNGGSVLSAGAWYCGVHGKGKSDEALNVVSRSDWDTAAAISAAVWAHPAARLLLDARTATELTALWADPASGVACKMRADALCDVGGTVVLPDLKTTEDASEDGFWRAVESYRYDLSACHYLHGLAAGGIAVDVVCLVMVEKRPPHAVGVYEIPRAVIEAQEGPRAALLARWAECDRTGVWPAFADEIVTPDVPGWFAAGTRDQPTGLLNTRGRDPMTMTAERTNQLATTKRVYQPLAPVGTAGVLKSLMEAQRGSIAEMLPKHITPERLFKTLLVAANRTPDLLQCTQASLLETINRAAELGLDLSGTLGEAYPVPFNNNVGTREKPQWVKQCQLIIGYRGLAKLARQSGEIMRIDADVVCEHDTFVMRKGSDARCEFEPNYKGGRGEPVGAYAYVRFKDGGEQFDFMPVPDIENIRKRSKAGSDKNGNAIGAWKSDWGEMAKKTVFKRVAKWLPLSTEKFVRAMETDAADFDAAEVLAVTTGEAAARGVAALNRRITERPVSEGQTFEPEPGAGDAVAAQDAHATEAAADQDQHGTDPADDGEAPPADERRWNVATWVDTYESLTEAAQAAEPPLSESDLQTRVNLWVVGAGAKGKEDKKTTPDQRMALVHAVAAGRLAPDGKIVA